MAGFLRPSTLPHFPKRPCWMMDGTLVSVELPFGICGAWSQACIFTRGALLDLGPILSFSSHPVLGTMIGLQDSDDLSLMGASYGWLSR